MLKQWTSELEALGSDLTIHLSGLAFFLSRVDPTGIPNRVTSVIAQGATHWTAMVTLVVLMLVNSVLIMIA